MFQKINKLLGRILTVKDKLFIITRSARMISHVKVNYFTKPESLYPLSVWKDQQFTEVQVRITKATGVSLRTVKYIANRNKVYSGATLEFISPKERLNNKN